MSAQPGRPESPRVQRLKQEAKDLKLQRRIKHHAALREIALREGFESWEHLLEADDHDGCDAQPTEAQVRDAERRAIAYGRPA